MKRELKIGDRVRVRGFRTVAIVFRIDDSVKTREAEVRLDREINGFRWWSLSDLVAAAQRKGAANATR